MSDFFISLARQALGMRSEIRPLLHLQSQATSVLSDPYGFDSAERDLSWRQANDLLHVEKARTRANSVSRNPLGNPISDPGEGPFHGLAPGLRTYHQASGVMQASAERNGVYNSPNESFDQMTDPWHEVVKELSAPLHTGRAPFPPATATPITREYGMPAWPAFHVESRIGSQRPVDGTPARVQTAEESTATLQASYPGHGQNGREGLLTPTGEKSAGGVSRRQVPSEKSSAIMSAPSPHALHGSAMPSRPSEVELALQALAASQEQQQKTLHAPTSPQAGPNHVLLDPSAVPVAGSVASLSARNRLSTVSVDWSLQSSEATNGTNLSALSRDFPGKAQSQSFQGVAETPFDPNSQPSFLPAVHLTGQNVMTSQNRGKRIRSTYAASADRKTRSKSGGSKRKEPLHAEISSADVSRSANALPFVHSPTDTPGSTVSQAHKSVGRETHSELTGALPDSASFRRSHASKSATALLDATSAAGAEGDALKDSGQLESAVHHFPTSIQQQAEHSPQPPVLLSSARSFVLPPVADTTNAKAQRLPTRNSDADEHRSPVTHHDRSHDLAHVATRSVAAALSATAITVRYGRTGWPLRSTPFELVPAADGYLLQNGGSHASLVSESGNSAHGNYAVARALPHPGVEVPTKSVRQRASSAATSQDSSSLPSAEFRLGTAKAAASDLAASDAPQPHSLAGSVERLPIQRVVSTAIETFPSSGRPSILADTEAMLPLRTEPDATGPLAHLPFRMENVGDRPSTPTLPVKAELTTTQSASSTRFGSAEPQHPFSTAIAAQTLSSLQDNVIMHETPSSVPDSIFRSPVSVKGSGRWAPGLSTGAVSIHPVPSQQRLRHPAPEWRQGANLRTPFTFHDHAAIPDDSTRPVPAEQHLRPLKDPVLDSPASATLSLLPVTSVAVSRSVGEPGEHLEAWKAWQPPAQNEHLTTIQRANTLAAAKDRVRVVQGSGPTAPQDKQTPTKAQTSILPSTPPTPAQPAIEHGLVHRTASEPANPLFATGTTLSAADTLDNTFGTAKAAVPSSAARSIRAPGIFTKNVLESPRSVRSQKDRTGRLSPPESPPVRIHIDRISIAAPASPPRRRVRPVPTLSLQQYLSGRTGKQ